MNLFVIVDAFFLILSVILAIRFAFENDSSMYYGFIMIAYLIARQGNADVVGD